MARNSEKNYGRLNRLWLEKQGVKTEKRPKLSVLKTSDEISYWLPSIKNELDFVLKQTEVPCYTEKKIEDYRDRIRYLEAEYKAFVRKLHKVNGTLKTTPWTARPYEKRSVACSIHIPVLHPVDTDSGSQCLNPLETPVLLHDHLYEDGECDKGRESSCTSSAANDEKPLEFNVMSSSSLKYPLQAPTMEHFTSATSTNILGLDYSSSDEDS